MPALPRLARPLVAVFVLALALAAAAPPARAESVVTVTDDPAMVAAVAEAQSHLDRVFDVAIGADGAGHPALTLKVAFPAGTGAEVGEEVIWVAQVARAGGRFTAILANEPLHLPDLAAGDTVTFDRDMIADWGLVGENGKLFGHYTTRVLLETMSQDQAAQIGALLNDTPLPATWQ